MVRTVVEVSFKTNYGITRERAFLDSVAETFFYRGEESLRYGAADDRLCKLERIAVAGRELDPNVTELAVSA